MAETTTKGRSKTELLDQMLEDIAGEELSEFNDDLVGLDAEFEVFSEVDHFAEIDSYH